MQANPDRLKAHLRDRLFKWTALSEIRTETYETFDDVCFSSVAHRSEDFVWRSVLLTYITQTGKEINHGHHRMHLQLDKA